MFTHKSLIVSFALILALVCTGIVAASAHTSQSVQKQRSIVSYPTGIAAISMLHKNQNILSFLDVKHYLNAKGFIGGTTLNGKPPILQDLLLTNALHLDSLLHFLLPEQPGDKQVYYAHLNGPFLVMPDLPLPVLSTLLPSLSNLPAFLPHLSNLSSLGLLNTSALAGRMPDLSNLQDNSSSLKSSNLKKIILSSVYEIFDAHSGNLLAWG